MQARKDSMSAIMESIQAGNMANAKAQAIEIDLLRAALQRIADGEVMSGTFTHAETVHEYQRIASAALAQRVTL